VKLVKGLLRLKGVTVQWSYPELGNTVFFPGDGCREVMGVVSVVGVVERAKLVVLVEGLH